MKKKTKKKVSVREVRRDLKTLSRTEVLKKHGLSFSQLGAITNGKKKIVKAARVETFFENPDEALDELRRLLDAGKNPTLSLTRQYIVRV